MTAPLPPLSDEGAQASYVAGLTALRAGDHARAIPLLELAVHAQPQHAGRRRNLARALLAAQHYPAACDAVEAALTLSPNDPELLFALGSASSAIGNATRATAAFGKALHINPDHAPSWLNLANLHVDQDDLTTGEAFCRRAIQVDPTLVEAHTSLGYVLTRVGRLPEAIAACDQALRRRPDFVQAHWNRAIALLLSGDFTAGFAAFEWRKRHPMFGCDFASLPGPEWRGGDLAAKRILIRSEQGAGDTIQFARYATAIRDQGGTPILACDKALMPLLRRVADVVDRTDRSLPNYDAWIDQASLPLAFATTLNTIPVVQGYLSADPNRTRRWHERLPSGPRVGLTFTGNPHHSGDRRRSISPDLFMPLLAAEGVTFINLQHGPAADAIDLPTLTHLLPDFSETAALIEALDLVITVDTSIAHLAGALGKPAWVLLPHAPDWRWMLQRSDSPWYRSLRLYRQPAPGDWLATLSHVRHDLHHWCLEISARWPPYRSS